MKKNSINRFTVIMFTALCMLTTANVFAGKHHPATATNTKPSTHKKDAYMAYVQISLSGTADTPYVSFNSPPAEVYTNVTEALSRSVGLFHVHITFMNKDEEIVGEDDYYIDNR